MFLLMLLALMSTLSYADGEENSPNESMKQVGASLVDDGEEIYLGSQVAISLSGHRIAIANSDYSHSSYVKVMEYDRGTQQWNQVGETIKNPMPMWTQGEKDQWGDSIDLNDDGTIIAIGLPGSFEFYGRSRAITIGFVLVFKWSVELSIWDLMGQPIEGKLRDDTYEGKTEGRPDDTGRAVSLSGDGLTLAVGVMEKVCFTAMGSGAGSAMIYKFVGTDWVQHGATLVGDRASSSLTQSSSDKSLNGENFGSLVSLSKDGTHLAVAANNAWDADGLTHAGRVRIFKDDGSNFVKVDEFYGQHWSKDVTGGRKDDGDQLARSMDMNKDGSRIVVSAEYGHSSAESGDDGYAKVYEYDSDTNKYVQVGQTLIGPDGEEAFGSAVAINADGDRILVGDYYVDTDAYYAGKVRVYDYCEEGSKQWTQLTPNGVGGEDDSVNGDYYDYLGKDADMSANGLRMVIGAKRGGYEGYQGKVVIFDIPNPSTMCTLEFCDWGCYLDNYPDLKADYGTDWRKGRQHYIDSGINENRDCTCHIGHNANCEISACTSSCETGAQRTFTDTTANVGNGCSTIFPNCEDGDGACVLFDLEENAGCWGKKNQRIETHSADDHGVYSCKAKCMADDSCTGVHVANHRCILRSGPIKTNPKTGRSCWTKKLPTSEWKTDVCAGATLADMCDGLCTDLTGDLGTKACAIMGKDQLISAFCVRDHPPRRSLSPLPTYGSDCEAKTSYTAENKFCIKSMLGAKMYGTSLHQCEAACSKDAACLGFFRRKSMCILQSSLSDMKPSSTGKCYTKVDLTQESGPTR